MITAFPECLDTLMNRGIAYVKENHFPFFFLYCSKELSGSEVNKQQGRSTYLCQSTRRRLPQRGASRKTCGRTFLSIQNEKRAFLQRQEGDRKQDLHTLDSFTDQPQIPLPLDSCLKTATRACGCCAAFALSW